MLTPEYIEQFKRQIDDFAAVVNEAQQESSEPIEQEIMADVLEAIDNLTEKLTGL